MPTRSKPAKKKATRRSAGTGVTGDRKAFESVLRVLLDASAGSKLRNDALSALQAAAFDTVNFPRYRPAYMSALRSLRNDRDAELRQRVFGVLAREKDEDTQEVLIAGLDDPEKALLPPEKALQLLSYDPHAGAYEAARKVEKAPPNPVARREALRVLASDAKSVELFEGVLGDKGESAPIRQLAASALNHLAPKRMMAMARDVVVDDKESVELRSACLTALTNFGDPAVLAQDRELHRQVDRYRSTATESAGPLQSAAAAFKRRYG